MYLQCQANEPAVFSDGNPMEIKWLPLTIKRFLLEIRRLPLMSYANLMRSNRKVMISFENATGIFRLKVHYFVWKLCNQTLFLMKSMISNGIQPISYTSQWTSDDAQCKSIGYSMTAMGNTISVRSHMSFRKAYVFLQKVCGRSLHVFSWDFQWIPMGAIISSRNCSIRRLQRKSHEILWTSIWNHWIPSENQLAPVGNLLCWQNFHQGSIHSQWKSLHVQWIPMMNQHTSIDIHSLHFHENSIGLLWEVLWILSIIPWKFIGG